MSNKLNQSPPLCEVLHVGAPGTQERTGVYEHRERTRRRNYLRRDRNRNVVGLPFNYEYVTRCNEFHQRINSEPEPGWFMVSSLTARYVGLDDEHGMPVRDLLLKCRFLEESVNEILSDYVDAWLGGGAAPVLLVSPDGRPPRFPRQLSRQLLSFDLRSGGIYFYQHSLARDMAISIPLLKDRGICSWASVKIMESPGLIELSRLQKPEPGISLEELFRND